MVHFKRVKSPCVGVCSTGIGDSVCRGCKRFMHEVIDWNSYSAEEQATVIGRISQLVRQVSEPIIQIKDQAALLEALRYQHVRFDELAGPYVWILELLKVGASTLKGLDDFGCEITPAYQSWSLVEIREQIDRDFFTLSQVHYERYFSLLKKQGRSDSEL